MYLKDFDRNHKNGCKRFLDFWRKISDNKNSIGIIEYSNETNIYTLQYNKTYDKEYVALIYWGVTYFFPLLNTHEYKDENINFDDEITDRNLFDLFKLLNNKKNFYVV